MDMRPRDERVMEAYGLASRFNVLFAGTMGMQQGLASVLAAARLCVADLPRVQFVFVGGGTERESLEQRAKQMGLSNVAFLPRHRPEDMGPLLAAADVLLVHLRDLPLFRITIPSKTSAYLAAGRPILMAVGGDAADLVRQSGAGRLLCAGEPGGSGLYHQAVCGHAGAGEKPYGAEWLQILQAAAFAPCRGREVRSRVRQSCCIEASC